MSHTQYFSPTPAHSRNVVARVHTAYTASGGTPPTSFVDELKAHLRTVPTAQQVAADIGTRAYRADAGEDIAKFWRAGVKEMADAMAADHLRDQIIQRLEVEQRSQAGRIISRAIKDLHPWAVRAAEDLATAAQDLPADKPTDPEAVLAADAGAALTTARRALSTLALWASIPDTGVHVSSAMQLARVLPVLDPGKVTVEARTHLGRTVNEDSLEATNSLRRLERDVRTDIDRALIGVARSEYPGLALTPVTALADVKDRARTIRDAFITRSVDEATANKMVAMR